MGGKDEDDFYPCQVGDFSKSELSYSFNDRSCLGESLSFG